jgi:hypothetical protein
MFKQTAATARLQATALGLALIVTLSMLSSVNQLATQPHDAVLAQSAAPATAMQVVVIEGHRQARS